MQGLVERHNREVKNIARSLLIDSGLPPTFWAHALKTAAYIKNRISTRNGPTPYELLKSDKPDLSNMRIFGSPCYAFIEKDDRKPSDHKASAELCTMVGYDDHSPGYMLFRSRRKPNSAVINVIIVRRDVVFDEAFTSSMPTMLGKYTRDVAELREQERMIDDENPFRVAQPKPRRKPTQADVDKLWTPSVRIPGTHLNQDDKRRTIVNNTADKPTGRGKGQVREYIKERCALVDGKSTAQVIGQVRYKHASGIYRNYTKKDLHYDLKHRHIEIQQNDLNQGELAAYASAYESACEVFEACAAVHNGNDLQSH